MTYSNLATRKILSGHQSHDAGIGLGEDFPYLKYAWELYVRDTDSRGHTLITLPPLIAKTVELPRWSTDTQVVNVYNHKTIVQTKFNWEPITISFYDQVNKSAECLIWHFVKAQFDAPDGSKAPKHKDLDLEIRMKNLSSPGQFKDKVYKLKKAYIVDAQHDTLDYSVSDVVLWTVTIRYEELEFEDCDFKGPAPLAPTGVAKRPKPAPVNRQDRRTSSSRFTPQRSVPPDAQTETEPNRWVEAGGLETPAGGAYGNPTLLRQGERIRRNREEQERLRRERDAQNPPGPSIGDRIRNFIGWPRARSAASEASPSTGSNAPAVASTGQDSIPRSLTTTQQQFIKEETAYVRNDRGLNPEWKNAYIEALKKNPPSTNNAQSQETARNLAETRAAAAGPKYTSQVRTQAAPGVSVDTGREPAPAPIRDGLDPQRVRANDTRGNQAVETQQRREEVANRLRSQGTTVTTGAGVP